MSKRLPSTKHLGRDEAEQIGTRISNSLESEVREKIASTAREQLKEEIREQVAKVVRDNLREAIQSGIAQMQSGGGDPQRLLSAVRERLSDTFETRIASGIRVRRSTRKSALLIEAQDF
jgi:hypothetical protein